MDFIATCCCGVQKRRTDVNQAWIIMEGRSQGDTERNRRVCSKKSAIDIPSLICFLPLAKLWLCSAHSIPVAGSGLRGCVLEAVAGAVQLRVLSLLRAFSHHARPCVLDEEALDR